MSTIPSLPKNAEPKTAASSTGHLASTRQASSNQAIDRAQSLDNNATTLTRAEIGTIIKAQILQSRPIQPSTTQSATTPQMTSTRVTSPLLNTTLVYTPATLEQFKIEQFKIEQFALAAFSNNALFKAQSHTPLQPNAVSLKESMQLALISQQYQLIAEIGGNRLSLLSSLPLRAGEFILLQKMSAQGWQVLASPDQPIKTTAFLLAFVAPSRQISNWLQLAWQLSQAVSSTHTRRDNANPLSSPVVNNASAQLPKPIMQFFQTLLSVQQIEANMVKASMAAETPSSTASKTSQLIHLVKNSINNSGLTFESKLAAFSRLPTDQQTQLLKLWQQGSSTRADLNFTQDQKFTLANLFSALHTAKQTLANQVSLTPPENNSLDNMLPSQSSLAQWLTAIKKLLPTLTQTVTGRETLPLRDLTHPLWQSFFFPTAPINNMAEEENAQFIVQLMEQIRQQLNRTHVQQLQSLLPGTDAPSDRKENPFSFCFDLPLLTDKGYERIPIWIEGEKKKVSSPQKPRSQWRVVLAFDLPDLGKIITDCRLTPPENTHDIEKSTLQMQFFSESATTNQCVDQHISNLTRALQAFGIEVSHQACRSPLPPLGDQRFQHDWVHLQV